MAQWSSHRSLYQKLSIPFPFYVECSLASLPTPSFPSLSPAPQFRWFEPVQDILFLRFFLHLNLPTHPAVFVLIRIVLHFLTLEGPHFLGTTLLLLGLPVIIFSA